MRARVREHCEACRLRRSRCCRAAHQLSHVLFSDAADAIAARLLARVSGRCADANRRGEVDATVATVSVTGTGTALEDDVVDCTDATTECESAVSEDTTIVDVTVVDC